jgi:transposase-like protein
MDSQAQSCHNPDCPARGQPGLGNIRIPGRAERRYRGTTCGRTFAETRGTPSDRLKKAADLVTIVRTSLGHGCPPQAIVAAFGLDERTVAAGRDRAGRHGQHFHAHRVPGGRVESGHVQADELSVKAVARRLGMALAMAVPSRLWPGGVIRPRRDLTLLMAVVRMVRAAARSLAILVDVAGLASSVTAFPRVVRDRERTGRRGRPRLVPTTGLRLGQVIKHRAGRCPPE